MNPVPPAPQAHPDHKPAHPRRKQAGPRRLAALLVVAAAVAVGAIYGLRHLQFVLRHEETDDAQVEGDLSPVLPRISGYVGAIAVRDNQTVEAGQTLFEIDARDLELRVAQAVAGLQSAEAARENARAQLANARAAEAVAHANVATGAVTQAKASADLQRDTRLFQTGAITDRELADSRAAADLARARQEAVLRQAEAAATQVEAARVQIAAAEAGLKQRQADLDYARLQRSYATVTAPIAGQISHKSVEPGQYVQAGQTLLSVASAKAVWIVANFKETQVGRMRVGQPAEIRVDAYPDRIFPGRIESLSGATGARFALLPPDNASGNFVKVTQRVPVKIVLEGAPDPLRPLRQGMSVDVAVKVRD